MKRLDTQQPGYTLIELLLAMGLFAIGMIAVASIFPAAAHMQRSTMEQITSKQIGRSAEAMLHARPNVELDLATDMNSSYPNQTISAPNYDWDVDEKLRPLPTPPTNTTDWTHASYRGFPGEEVVSDTYGKDYYWLPLVRDTSSTAGDHQFEHVILMLRKDANLPPNGYDARSPTRAGPFSAPFTRCANLDTNTPSNSNIPIVLELEVACNAGSKTFTFNNIDAADGQLIMPGDLVVDCFGNSYRVLSADGGMIEVDKVIGSSSAGVPPDRLWFARGLLRQGSFPDAPYPAKSSPLRYVYTVTDDNPGDAITPSK